MTVPDIDIIEFDGRQVEVRQAGSGPVLFFLHGIGSGSRAWIHQFPAFSDRYRTIAWAAPGYGQSTDVDTETPLAGDYAKVLLGLFDAMGIDQAILCGNSLGCLFSGAFAALAPERLRGLFLSDAARGHRHLGEEKRLEGMHRRLKPLEELGVAEMARQRAANLVAPGTDPEIVATVASITAEIRPVGYRRASWALSLGEIKEDLAGFTKPVALVCGSKDTITPPDTNRDIAAGIPQATFALIDGVGHLPYIEAPETFNRLLGDFVDGLA